jgi:small-conductance mechanosensitive channel
MELPSKTVVDVLTYLMPGFITAAIVYNLTPAPRPIPFERVVLALIFTIAVQVLVLILKTALSLAGSSGINFGPWTDETQLLWSVLFAVLLGLILAYLANTDRLHSYLRKLGITHQTSYSSEWYGVLSQNRGFVVLHLVGQRRLYGWAEEWPSTADQGHFVISLAEWLDGDTRIPATGVERILIKATEVEMIELMSPLGIQTEEYDG